MNVVLWTLVAFLCGSIPFSVLIGYLAIGVDIREYGDHNPGATNVMRAASWRWFIPALLLDYFKGAVPVGLAYFFARLEGWEIVPVALAPIIGHAYSPWLSFRGGKAVAVTFGVWTGLTGFVGPLILGLLLPLLFSVFVVSGWSAFITMLSFGGFVLLYYSSQSPAFVAVWLANLALIVWKHRHDLQQPPGIRPWLLRIVSRTR